jgi:acyl-CoA synthetase (AMP-forming)/AMP-acid ligase II
VREVAVFGIPDDKWGETPVAAIVLNAPGSATADEIREWVNARVAAKYQRLARVVVMDEFPRNAAGKTLKRELRAPFWKGRDSAL